MATEDMLIGLVAAIVALLLAKRVFVAIHDGIIPLYRTRLTRAEAGTGKFNSLILLNLIGMLAMAAIAADLLFGLGLRGHF